MYTEIVAVLRQRIEAGELAPGDRVPSTREIKRQWGVAMATATRVLAELRHAGLVRAVPGVGTVVAERRQAGGHGAEGRRPGGDRRGPAGGVGGERRQPGGVGGERGRAARTGAALATPRIVAAAVAVADAEGLAAISMRRVATELGVATMSLYRHVADKEGLLTQMMDVTFAEWPFPADPPGGWRARLELAARMLWALFRRHPWLAQAMSVTRPQPVPSAMPFTEWVLAALAERGLDLSTCLTAHITLFNHVRATALNLESEAEAEALSGLNSEEWMDGQEQAFQAILATGRFPTFARLVAAGYDFDLDNLFEFGLRSLLDGIGVLLGEIGSSGDDC